MTFTLPWLFAASSVGLLGFQHTALMNWEVSLRDAELEPEKWRLAMGLDMDL